jgi:hypothetical protein
MVFTQVEEELARKSEAKRKRCYHRVISGLKRGGTVRFLTLTSSDAAPADIQRSWRCLYMRCLRRGLIIGYIKVPEQADDGRKHLHILFRGKFIDQQWLKAQWSQIHNSQVVDIRLVKFKGDARRVAGYMAKYMSKRSAGRYSWSWSWVWKGFCQDWTHYKRYWWKTIYREGRNTFQDCINGWDMWLSGVYIVDRELLAEACLTTGMPPEAIFRFSHVPFACTP